LVLITFSRITLKRALNLHPDIDVTVKIFLLSTKQFKEVSTLL